jgi:hypothetical protein
MSLLLRAALLCFLLASFAIAARAATYDDPLLRNAAAAELPADAGPTHWTRSSAELAAADAEAFTVDGVDDADLLAIVATAPASATTAHGPLRAGIGSVPEPQGYALLCAGLGLLGVARRRGGFRFQAAGVRPNEAR